jgi:hypothetical protein
MEASTVNEGFFTEARSLFEEIVAWLGSDVVCGLEHEQLEKNLFVNGNELRGKFMSDRSLRPSFLRLRSPTPTPRRIDI